MCVVYTYVTHVCSGVCAHTRVCKDQREILGALLCHRLKLGRQPASPSILPVLSPHIIKVTGMHMTVLLFMWVLGSELRS